MKIKAKICRQTLKSLKVDVMDVDVEDNTVKKQKNMFSD